MTSTAPDVERRYPLDFGSEHESLLAWLAFYRDSLLLKCAGLTTEQLRERSCAPSTLSLLGLVRHMTEVERVWFRVRIAGENVPFQYWSGSDFDADFNGVDIADAEADFARFRAEVEYVQTLTVGRDLDEVIEYTDRRGTALRHDVRWILTHMVEEYARHLGHADLLRERIDGATGY